MLGTGTPKKHEPKEENNEETAERTENKTKDNKYCTTKHFQVFPSAVN
jgi:hypothetical protein